MSTNRYLGAQEVCQLLTAAEVLTPEGRLWTIEQVATWMRAAGEYRDGVQVVAAEVLHQHFREVQTMLDEPEPSGLPEPSPAPLQEERGFNVREVAACLGWSRRTTREWLLRLGVVERRGLRLWVTTADKLQGIWPELAHKLLGDQTIVLVTPAQAARAHGGSTRNIRRQARRVGAARQLGRRYVVAVPVEQPDPGHTPR